MGEKATLRLALADAEERATTARLNLSAASQELLRVRSDCTTLEHRLEAAYTEVRNRRAFQAAVAELSAVVARLNLLPDASSPKISQYEEWVHDVRGIFEMEVHDNMVTLPVETVRPLLTELGFRLLRRDNARET